MFTVAVVVASIPNVAVVAYVIVVVVVTALFSCDNQKEDTYFMATPSDDNISVSIVFSPARDVVVVVAVKYLKLIFNTYFIRHFKMTLRYILVYHLK